MKLYGLYLAEANERNDEQGGSRIGTIIDAALAGIAKALLFLGAIVYHGLLGKAVMADKITAKDAIKAARLNRDKQLEEYLKQHGRERTPEEQELEDEFKQLEEKLYDITDQIRQMGGEEAAKKLVAEYVDSESPGDGRTTFKDAVAGGAAISEAWQAKIQWTKKLIQRAQKTLDGMADDEPAATPDEPDAPAPEEKLPSVSLDAKDDTEIDSDIDLG